MKSKKKLSKRSCLCVITDLEFCGNNILRIVSKAASSGAGMIQFRAKNIVTGEMVRIGRAIKKITGRCGVPLIVNDRLDVALAIDADGVHLGQGDISIRAARKALGKDKLIGISVTNFAQAKAAKSAGADYLGAGPIFKTPLKKRKARGIELLKHIKKLNIPVFAIGGIDQTNIGLLAKEGFNKAAVIRAVCSSTDPSREVKILRKALV